jgi:hypothetical protein
MSPAPFNYLSTEWVESNGSQRWTLVTSQIKTQTNIPIKLLFRLVPAFCERIKSVRETVVKDREPN